MFCDQQDSNIICKLLIAHMYESRIRGTKGQQNEKKQKRKFATGPGSLLSYLFLYKGTFSS